MTLFIGPKGAHIPWPSDSTGSDFTPMHVPNTMQVSITQPFINTEHERHETDPHHTLKISLLSNRYNGIAFFVGFFVVVFALFACFIF